MSLKIIGIRSWNQTHIIDSTKTYFHELSGEPLAILDIAWPNGLQEGYSQPVALLIDEERETEEVVNNMGFRIFRDPANFKDYVLRDIVVADELAA